MPNWCYNTLRIKGNKEELAKLKRFVKGDKAKWLGKSDFDFDNIIPYPLEYKEKDMDAQRMSDLMAINKNGNKKKLTKEETKEAVMLKLKHGWDNFYTDGFNSGGYDWCCANWGTKWNASDVEVQVKKNKKGDMSEINYAFHTAWEPPMPVILRLSSTFPTLTIKMNATYEGEDGEDNSIIKGGIAAYK